MGLPNKDNIIVGKATLKIDGVNVGHTQGGVTFAKNNEFLDVKSDQVAGTVKKFITDQTGTLSTTLLEPTLENIRKAMGEPSSQQFSGSALSIGEDVPTVTEHTLVVEGKPPGTSNTTRTYTFTRCVAMNEVSHLIGARDAISVVPIEFDVLKDPDNDNTFGTVEDT